jgi:tetratricopeptide (TPR) repeat protein
MNIRFSLQWMIVLYFLCLWTVQAQEMAETGIKTEAQQALAEKNYARALPLFKELLRETPSDPLYQYGTGVCLVNLNQDLELAIQLLRTSTLAMQEPQALFYLGRALHLNYSFDEAIKAYSRCLATATPSSIAPAEIERLIEMARNGLELTREGKPLDVLSSQIINIEQIPIVGEINGSGKLMRKPAEFCTRFDLKANYKSWMFLPVFTEINDFVYVSGIEKSSDAQKQLFRIKNINHTLWGVMETLDPTVNTPYDEEYPYFDYRTSTLYFSSKGHTSMGGYDIFKTVYDWNMKAWSKPENMGYPINSPADDYLFITDIYNHTASFVSSRSSGPNQVAVYRIRLPQGTSGLVFSDADAILRASLLIIEKPEPPQSLVIQKPQDEKKYAEVLAEAMRLQIKADSLNRITLDKRLTAKNSPDEALKKQLITEIIQGDKEAKFFQREADKAFDQSRRLKNENPLNAPHTDTIVEVSREIHGITVYQYRTVPDKEPGMESSATGRIVETAADTAQKVQQMPVRSDNFIILASPSYNEKNPVPQKLEVFPGLVYRIQLGVFSKKKPNDAFGGIYPLVMDYNSSGNVYKYYAGVFYSSAGAAQALERVRGKGFPDAFLVAFLDGKTISAEKAREFEFAKFKVRQAP